MDIEFNDVAQIILALLLGVAAIMNAYARILHVRRQPTLSAGQLLTSESKTEPGKVEQLTSRIRRERRG